MAYERDDSLLDSLETIASVGLATLLTVALFRRGWSKVTSLPEWKKATAIATEDVAEYVNTVTATDEAVKAVTKNRKFARTIVESGIDLKQHVIIPDSGTILTQTDLLNLSNKGNFHVTGNLPDRRTAEMVDDFIFTEKNKTALEKLGFRSGYNRQTNEIWISHVTDKKAHLRLEIPSLKHGLTVSVLGGQAAPLHTLRGSVFGTTPVYGPYTGKGDEAFERTINSIVTKFKSSQKGTRLAPGLVVDEIVEALMSSEELGLNEALRQAIAGKKAGHHLRRIAESPYKIIGEIIDSVVRTEDGQILKTHPISRLKQLEHALKTLYTKPKEVYKQGNVAMTRIGSLLPPTTLQKAEILIEEGAVFERLSSYRIPILSEILGKLNKAAGKDPVSKQVFGEIASRIYTKFIEASGASFIHGRGKEMAEGAIFKQEQYIDDIFTIVGGGKKGPALFLSSVPLTKDTLHQLHKTSKPRRIYGARFGKTTNTVFTGPFGYNRVALPTYIAEPGTPLFNELVTRTPGLYGPEGSFGILPGAATRSVKTNMYKTKAIYNPNLRKMDLSGNFIVKEIVKGEVGGKITIKGMNTLEQAIEGVDGKRLGQDYVLVATKNISNIAGSEIKIEGQIGLTKGYSINKGTYINRVRFDDRPKDTYRGGGAVEKTKENVLIFETFTPRTLGSHTAISLTKGMTTYDLTASLNKQTQNLFYKELKHGGGVITGTTAGPGLEITTGMFQKWSLAYMDVMGTAPTESFNDAVATAINDAMNTTKTRVEQVMKSGNVTISPEITWASVFSEMLASKKTGKFNSTKWSSVKESHIGSGIQVADQPFYNIIANAFKLRYGDRRGHGKMDEGTLNYLSGEINVLQNERARIGNQRQNRILNELLLQHKQRLGVKTGQPTKAFYLRKYGIESEMTTEISIFKHHADKLNKNLNKLNIDDLTNIKTLEEWATKNNVQESLDYMRKKTWLGNELLTASSDKVRLSEAFLAMNIYKEAIGGEFSDIRLATNLDMLVSPNITYSTVGIRQDAAEGAKLRASKSYTVEDKLRFLLTGRKESAAFVDRIFAAQDVIAKQRLGGMYIKSAFGLPISEELIKAQKWVNTKDITKGQWKEIYEAYNKKDLETFLGKWKQYFGDAPIVANLTETGHIETIIEGPTAGIAKSRHLKTLLIPTLPDLGLSANTLRDGFFIDAGSKPIRATITLLDALFEAGGDLSTLAPEESTKVISEYTLAITEQMSQHYTALVNPTAISRKHGMTARTYQPINITSNMTGKEESLFFIELNKKDALSLINETNQTSRYKQLRKVQKGKFTDIETMQQILNESRVQVIAWPNIHDTSTMGVVAKVVDGKKLGSGKLNVSPALMIVLSRDTDNDQLGLFVEAINDSKGLNKAERDLEHNVALRKLATALGADIEDIKKLRPNAGTEATELTEAYNRVKTHIDNRLAAITEHKGLHVIGGKGEALSSMDWNAFISNTSSVDEKTLETIDKVYSILSNKQRLVYQTGIVTNLVTDMLHGVSGKIMSHKTHDLGRMLVLFAGGLIQTTIEKKTTTGAAALGDMATKMLSDYFNSGIDDVTTIVTETIDRMWNQPLSEVGKLYATLSLPEGLQTPGKIAGDILAEVGNYGNIDEAKQALTQAVLQGRAGALKLKNARSTGAIVNTLLKSLSFTIQQASPEEAAASLDNTVKLIAHITGMIDDPKAVAELIMEYPALAETVLGLESGYNIGTLSDSVEDAVASRRIREVGAIIRSAPDPAKAVTRGAMSGLLFNASGGMTTLAKIGTVGLMLFGAGALLNIATGGKREYNPSPMGAPLPIPPPNLNLGGPGGIIETPDHMSPTYSGGRPTNITYAVNDQVYLPIPDSRITLNMQGGNSGQIFDYQEGMGA